MKGLVIFIGLVAVAMAAKKATSAMFCTDNKEFGSEFASDYEDRYYKYPLLGNCQAQHLQNWKPSYKITEPATECPTGKASSAFWEDRGTCYFEGEKGMNFRDAEQECNMYKGHIFVPNDDAEMEWVTTRVYQKGGWHYLGFFCSTGNSPEIKDARTVTREDTRKIATTLNAKGGHPLHHQGNACWRNQARSQDANWYMKFHQSNCNDGDHFVCEIPLG